MKVEVILRENIKPSSPTPNHLKTFKLSLLDQLIPAPYAPIVLFYPNYNGASCVQILERLVLLQQSLSKTLTLFYPLAGTIKDDFTIDCNDEGAYYAVAEVNSSLSKFLDRPDLQMIDKFLPCEPGFNGSNTGTRVANFQVNVFECGGIAIGLCISHKILDGAALNTFLKGWTSTASGSGEVVFPNFEAPSLFPTNDLWLRDLSVVTWGSLFKKGKCTTKRFLFEASTISTLKAKASKKGVKQPTRVEVVSAFIWEHTMAASGQVSGSNRPSLMTHVVNLRKKIAPTLSEDSMGNLIWIASAKCAAKNDHGSKFHGLVDGVREGISKINGNFVKKMRGDEGADVMSKSLKKFGDYGSKEGVDYFGFTSWCKIGFYEADFGWGKPVWVSSVGLSGSVFMNLTVLMDTRCGEGIEAWVSLDEQEMDAFGGDLEVIALASMDPSPLSDGNY